jgi:hypothetical protein
MIPKKCPNYEQNKAECPCEFTDCPRLGFCCECLRYHRAQGETTACEREMGLRLPEATPAPAAEEGLEAEPFRLINYADCAG